MDNRIVTVFKDRKGELTYIVEYLCDEEVNSIRKMSDDLTIKRENIEKWLDFTEILGFTATINGQHFDWNNKEAEQFYENSK
jgi:hypothetical protein